MSCPFCGAEAVRRDYAPPRPFAYLLGGGGLLFAMLFMPDVFGTWAPWRQQVVKLIGLAALLVGSVELGRHGNLYCAECGMKFRRARRSAPGFDRHALLDAGAGAGGRAPGRGQVDVHDPGGAVGTEFAARARAAAARRSKDAPPADTPIPPLLKVLRFKNPAMRAEAAETLRKLTGQDHGEDADAWERWWAETQLRIKN